MFPCRAQPCTHTPHRLAGSLPVCHALHDRSGYGAGELGLVIAQGVIACGRSSVDARLQVSQPTQRADDELPQTVTLVLAVRPFQVNPPSQFLNTPGGVSPIRELAWDGEVVSVNGERRIFPLVPTDAFGAASFAAGSLPELLAANAWREASEVHDAFGYASGALVYRLHLPPHGGATTGLVMPLSGPALPAEFQGLSPREWLHRARDAVAAVWRAKLNRVSWRVPPAAQPLLDTLRTALAQY